MIRFPTLAYDPGQTRNVLRSRFCRTLPSRVILSAPRENPPEFKDEDVLAVLLDSEMQYNDELEIFRSRYEEVRSTSDVGLPTFEEAIARGWFRIVWGRVHSPRLRCEFLRHRKPPYESTLIDSSRAKRHLTWDGFAGDHYFPGDCLPYSAMNVPLTSTFGAPSALVSTSFAPCTLTSNFACSGVNVGG